MRSRFFRVFIGIAAIVLLFIGVIGFLRNRISNPQKPNFTSTLKLSIQPTKTEFAKKEPVCIDVTYQNIGLVEQNFDDYWRICPRIHVVFHGPVELPKTNYARNQEAFEDWSYSHSRKDWGVANPITLDDSNLKPGGKITHRYTVNDWSDLTAAGTQGKENLYIRFERFGVSSNEIMIQAELPASPAPPFAMDELK